MITHFQYGPNFKSSTQIIVENHERNLQTNCRRIQHFSLVAQIMRVPLKSIRSCLIEEHGAGLEGKWK